MRAAAQGRWTVVTRPTRRSSPPAPPRRPRGGGRGCGDEARGGRVRPGVRGPVADGVRGCDRRRSVPAGGGGPRPGRHQQASARRRSRIQCRIVAPLFCDTCLGGICVAALNTMNARPRSSERKGSSWSSLSSFRAKLLPAVRFCERRTGTSAGVPDTIPATEDGCACLRGMGGVDCRVDYQCSHWLAMVDRPEPSSATARPVACAEQSRATRLRAVALP